MSLILTVLLCLQETPERLVERLGAESIEERERAFKTLTDWGDKARAALLKAAGDADKEVAGRAREVLAVIDARKAGAEYRRVETAMLAARSLRVRFSTVEATQEGAILSENSGTLCFAPGDRVLAQVNPLPSGTRIRSTLATDGKSVYVRNRRGTHGGHQGFVAPKDLGSRIRRLFLDEGAAYLRYPTLATDLEEFENFLTLEPTPMDVCGTDGASATLTFHLSQADRQTTGTIWYDPKTLALQKRVLRMKAKDKETVETETYLEWTVDAALPEDYFDVAAWERGVKGAVRNLPGMEDVKDASGIDAGETAYCSVAEYLGRTVPERILQEGWTPGYSVFSERPGELRGNAIRLNLLFLQSNPIRLEKKIGEVEWIHRTYLCDATGQEGYVVDLLEAPPALKKKDRVQLEAVFLKIGEYEGQKGPVRAPFLLGQRLAVVPEK